MFSKKNVAMLVRKKQNERQLAIPIKCIFCCSVKKRNQRHGWHCHGNNEIFPSIITTCGFSNIDFISPISGSIVQCISAWLVQRFLM